MPRRRVMIVRCVAVSSPLSRGDRCRHDHLFVVSLLKRKVDPMVKRPADMKAFEFAVMSGLRAAQLHRGCTPRVEPCEKMIVTAQHEVATRKVLRVATVIETVLRFNE